MKHQRAVLSLLIIACLTAAFALAETDSPAAFTENQQLIFETVKWNVDFPKNAQITQAMEYLCKVEDYQLHLLLAEATQNEHIETMFGRSASVILIDLDSNAVITYSNCIWPESSDINSYEDALYMIFSCYLSYLEGNNPQIYADHEMTFPLTEEEISAVNTELANHFMR